MPSVDAPVLLDNCAISACLSAGAWKALCSRYTLETVEEVAAEAGTGYQYREVVDGIEFRAQVTVHQIEQQERLRRKLEFADLARLDEGESDLWVHALGRTDGWILCGPDTASIRFGVRTGNADRLISLEELLDKIGANTSRLPAHHRKKWLSERVAEFKLEVEFEKLRKS